MISEKAPLTSAPGFDRSLSKKETKYLQESKCFKSSVQCVGGCCFGLCMLYTPLGCGPFVTVTEGEVGLVMKFGKYDRKFGPGVHWINYCYETILKVDMMTQICDTPRQQLLTRDSVTISVDAFCQFRIVVPELAKLKTQNYEM
jgi:erythrocyte band 7 integral membrane protein